MQQCKLRAQIQKHFAHIHEDKNNHVTTLRHQTKWSVMCCCCGLSAVLLCQLFFGRKTFSAVFGRPSLGSSVHMSLEQYSDTGFNHP